MILIVLLVQNIWAFNCKNLEKAADYLDTEQFFKAVKAHKAAGNIDELAIKVKDINQARKYAYNFPAFKDLDFGTPGSSWEPFVVSMDKSSLHGLRAGWQKRTALGDLATVRLDWDPVNGAHYNISIVQKTSKGKETYKLAVQFDCSGLPCTADQIKKMAEGF